MVRVTSITLENESSSVIHKNRAGAQAPTRSTIISFWLYPNY